MAATALAPVVRFPVDVTRFSPAMPASAGSTTARLAEFKQALTTLHDPSSKMPFRVVMSSGGVAGGVISEGQGYGMLLAGIALASQPPSSPAWQEALSFAQELFAGWRRMCELSKNSCQDDARLRCGGRRKHEGEKAEGFAPCLPSWQFDEGLKSQRGSGSATDGDEDALLGLVLLLQSSSASAWPLWERTLSWTYESIRAFLHYNTQANGRGRLTRLGSCWGGWDCNNPSYIAPAHFRAFKAFSLRHGHLFGVSNATLRADADKWDNLIESSYAMLDDAQCDSTGLTPNWWRPAGSIQPRGFAGCNSSGTPADEFGAEAARGVWRVALDALWAPSEASTRYLSRVTQHLTSRLDGNGFGDLTVDRACEAVKSVHPGWQDRPFMYGPLASSLLLPIPGGGKAYADRQRRALELLSSKVAAGKIDDYYNGAWTALATATLNGDFATACSKVFSAKACPAKALVEQP